MTHAVDLIDHTADVAIRVEADTLGELFETAAFGLTKVLTEPVRVRPKLHREVHCQGEDLVDLMVEWLSELNLIFEQDRFLVSRAEIRFLQPRSLEEASTNGGPAQLVAEVEGEVRDPEVHPIHTGIKAVTYHGLAIEKENGRYRAQIIFDI